jgi:hypothetical protein
VRRICYENAELKHVTETMVNSSPNEEQESPRFSDILAWFCVADVSITFLQLKYRAAETTGHAPHRS